MTPDQHFECNSPDVVFENFGDEVILLNLASGRYFSLDPVGMVCWEYLSQGVPPAGLVEHLGAAYAGTVSAEDIAKHVESLVGEFAAEKLLRPSDTRQSVAGVGNETVQLPGQYAPPSLSKFDDIAEMLLLDPVHDVGDVGWPHPPSAAADRPSAGAD